MLGTFPTTSVLPAAAVQLERRAASGTVHAQLATQVHIQVQDLDHVRSVRPAPTPPPTLRPARPAKTARYRTLAPPPAVTAWLAATPTLPRTTSVSLAALAPSVVQGRPPATLNVQRGRRVVREASSARTARRVVTPTPVLRHAVAACLESLQQIPSLPHVPIAPAVAILGQWRQLPAASATQGFTPPLRPAAAACARAESTATSDPTPSDSRAWIVSPEPGAGPGRDHVPSARPESTAAPPRTSALPARLGPSPEKVSLCKQNEYCDNSKLTSFTLRFLCSGASSCASSCPAGRYAGAGAAVCQDCASGT